MKSRSLAVSAAFVCVLVSSARGASLPEFIGAAKKLTIANDVSPVNELAFSIGHLKVKMASGSAARVLAGSEPVGVFFKGSGSFAYEAAEPTELPIVRSNMRSESHLTSQGDGRHLILSESFGEVLFVGAGVPLPAISGTGGAPLADAFAAHQALFGRAMSPSPAHDLALQKFGVPAAGFVWLEISGGPDNLVYSYDAFESHEESLLLLRGPHYAQDDRRLAQRLSEVVISSQPIGRDRKSVDRPLFALTGVDYALTADGDDARLEMTETLVRPNAGQNAIRFVMLDEIFDKPNRPTRKFNVRSVTDEQGRVLPFDHYNRSLLVGLEGVQGQTFKLKFSIDGDFLIREGGDNVWQLGTFPWFPQPASYGAQAYTVHSLVKVKKPFVPLAPGKTVQRREDGDYNLLETSIDRPVQFTVVHAGKYTTTEETRNGLTVRVASYGLARTAQSKRLINLAFGLIEYYDYFLGPFPFSEYNIIQVNDYGWGQAPPATMFITNEAFDNLIDEAGRFFSQGINERIAHEIAHQYWAHVVKMPNPEEQWLTESFAEYSAALALKKLKSEGAYNRLVNTWRSRAKDATDVAPIPYANRIAGDPRTAFIQRFDLLYNKGPYLLYALHKELGDTQFLTFLKSYQRSFQWKFGTTNDIARVLQVLTRKDYQPFLDQYFWGTAMPN